MRMLQCEIFPIVVLLVDDEEEYYKLTKKVEQPTTFPAAGTAATINYASDTHGIVNMVVLGDHSELTAADVHSILTHEAVHIKQFLFEGIGEEHPGVETEAYTVQYFTDYLVKEWEYRQNKKAKQNEQK